MNERIRELWEQSLKEVFDYYAGAGVKPGEYYSNYKTVLDYEKFAELIVRECARVAAQTPCPYDDEDVRKTFGHTWDMACVESARDIRKYFGVEE